MKIRVLAILTGILFIGVFAIFVLPVTAQGTGQDGDQAYAGTVPAIPFPADLEWINVAAPLDWDTLQGKVVVLDFWTYGCINCIHIIPDLKQLEAEFAEELVVIGVHSAKFTSEGDTENIRQIVQRYEVEHPVVNDREFEVWSEWGAQAWPTLMLVDPQGKVFGYHAGEGAYQVLQPVIAGMVNEFDALGLIDRTPLELNLETENRPETLLAFPGKVLADVEDNRLFIADSNHNRIVIVSLDEYEVLSVVGGTDAGNMDGSYAVARFNKPQGLALSDDGNLLYVADTENHTLRVVDLVQETVTTIAGTGAQARFMSNGGIGTDAALNSPWDLSLVDEVLYIAMAGPHQLWRYDVATGAVGVHSGSGREAVTDGPHADAALAQPSGITTDGEVLYFADSEASAVRVSDIDPAAGVRTLVGTGLFDFGDRDGVGQAALLQHPLGVTFVDDLLYVADTYNNKIKMLDLQTTDVVSLNTDAAGGYRDGALADALFDEPGGINYAGGLLYVADTNNHAIRVIDLENGLVESVVFANPELLQAGRQSVVNAAPFTGKEVRLEPVQVGAGDSALQLAISVPEGYKLNDIATSLVAWQVDADVIGLAAEMQTQELVTLDAPLDVSVTLFEGAAVVSADITIYYCEAVNESLCFVERARLNLPVEVEASAEIAPLTLGYVIVPPEM